MLKIGICLSALALAAAAGLAQPNRLTPAEKTAGWQLLFDGRTLNGWDDPARKSPPGNSFAVEDGAIRVLAKPRIHEELFTTAVFGDFELLFDWRISPGGNSGLKYRIQDHVFVLRDPKVSRFEDLVELSLGKRPPRAARGQDYVIGFEYQVIDLAHRDAQRGARQQAGALYNLVGPPANAARPAGEWNEARVELRGNRAQHWLNGVKVVDVELDSPEIAEGLAARWRAGSMVCGLLTRQPRRETPISIQNHNDDAWFRNIKIRRLR